eukprot:757038-Rhodomonas_salina.2
MPVQRCVYAGTRSTTVAYADTHRPPALVWHWLYRYLRQYNTGCMEIRQRVSRKGRRLNEAADSGKPH